VHAFKTCMELRQPNNLHPLRTQTSPTARASYTIWTCKVHEMFLFIACSLVVLFTLCDPACYQKTRSPNFAEMSTRRVRTQNAHCFFAHGSSVVAQLGNKQRNKCANREQEHELSCSVVIHCS